MGAFSNHRPFYSWSGPIANIRKNRQINVSEKEKRRVGEIKKRIQKLTAIEYLQMYLNAFGLDGGENVFN